MTDPEESPKGTYNPRTDPYDHLWGNYVECVGMIGNAARHAHEAAQDNRPGDAAGWLRSATEWAERAMKVLPDLRPMDAETVARIQAERVS